MEKQPALYEHDRVLWNRCATTYERQIVRGHPDVMAYESFEHSFLEKLVIFLTHDCRNNLHCYDFGCGSGRLHLQLAPFLTPAITSKKSKGTVNEAIKSVHHIGGIDFSEQMIALARQNLTTAGLNEWIPDYLSFDIGSAFDVSPYLGKCMPFAVSVCNSIGVMQGSQGAKKLFSTMQQYIKPRHGIAVISCYMREAVPGFALGNYESTMDVCGQPCWLQPNTFARPEYTLVPKYYKRMHDNNPNISVDVFNDKGVCIQDNFQLTRNDEAVRKVIENGEIRTMSKYHSNWYSTHQMKEWMCEFWSDGMMWHIPGSTLDRLRGEPAQLAVVDYSGNFQSLAKKWGLTSLN